MIQTKSPRITYFSFLFLALLVTLPSFVFADKTPALADPSLVQDAGIPTVSPSKVKDK